MIDPITDWESELGQIRGEEKGRRALIVEGGRLVLLALKGSK